MTTSGCAPDSCGAEPGLDAISISTTGTGLKIDPGCFLLYTGESCISGLSFVGQLASQNYVNNHGDRLRQENLEMSERQRHIFTSESVTEGHPDKIADQISDAVLDAVLEQDPYGRVACETLVTTGICMVAGEITTKCYVDVARLARETIEHVGYTDAAFGFDHKTCGVLNVIQPQSPDIAMGVDPGGAAIRA